MLTRAFFSQQIIFYYVSRPQFALDYRPIFIFSNYAHSVYHLRASPLYMTVTKLSYLDLSLISLYRRGLSFLFTLILTFDWRLNIRQRESCLRINCLLLLLLLFVYELPAITTYYANRTLPTSTLTPYLLTYQLTYAAD